MEHLVGAVTAEEVVATGKNSHEYLYVGMLTGATQSWYNP